MDTQVDNQRLLAAAIRRLDSITRATAFDPANPDSVPTAQQKQVCDDFGVVPTQVVVAGTQCLIEGTLVSTPSGPVSIERLQPGDTVYNEYGKPIKVKRVFNNGRKEVANLTRNGTVWGSCTESHVFLIENSQGKRHERTAGSLQRDDLVYTVRPRSQLGNVQESHAYAIGALLGDGCSKQPHRYIQISSATFHIPEKVASILGGEHRRLHKNNYTWSLGYVDCNYYNQWCHNRYAHEKIVDLEVIRSWNRSSLLQFVAGIIDTDGSIYPARDHISLSLGMQARSVIDAFEYAVLALWGIQLNRTIDSRSKYKNGPVHIAYTRNSTFIRFIMEELDSHLVSEQKKWRPEYATLGGRRTRIDAVGLKWGSNRRFANTYDIHVDSDTNLYLLANGLVTHNSGKSQTAARNFTWMATETHPTWVRPKEWGNERLLIVVAGRTGKQIENSLIPKLVSFLEPGTFKYVKAGNSTAAIDLDNGNRFVFQSLENPEQARQRLQSYVAHGAWLDEMPPKMSIFTELQSRVQARSGIFLSTFTPLVEDVEIQRYVDNLKEPYGKKYQFAMLDNPLYHDQVKRDKILTEYSLLPESVRNTRLFGAWSSSENAVYHYDIDRMFRTLPETYSTGWRHAVAVDPALQSALGLVLAAEDPITGSWYAVRAEEISGIPVPEDMVLAVEERLRGYNIVRRTADPHESWYINTARKKGYHYQIIKKDGRKGELIKGVQAALGTRFYLTPGCPDLGEDLVNCKWSDKAEERIVNSSKWHRLDALQYLIDNLPSYSGPGIQVESWDQYLYLANEKRKKIAAAKARIRQRKFR